jgi:hypothetical protein
VERLKKIYLVSGFIFVLVTFVRFVCEAGQPSDYYGLDEVQQKGIIVYVPLLASMLIYPICGGVIGVVQANCALPGSLRRITAASYWVGLLLYIYWLDFVLRDLITEGIVGALWKFLLGLGFAGGVLLMIAISVCGFGLLLSRNRENERDMKPHANGGYAMAGLKVYMVGGLALVLIPLAAWWYDGAAAWLWNNPPGMLVMVAGWLAYPTCAALGTLGVLLGIVQQHIKVPVAWQVVLGIAYLAGGGIFSLALYLDAESNWSRGLSPLLLVGLTLLLFSLVINLVAVLVTRAESSVQSAGN